MIGAFYLRIFNVYNIRIYYIKNHNKLIIINFNTYFSFLFYYFFIYTINSLAFTYSYKRSDYKFMVFEKKEVVVMNR